ncbi:MAG TPA: class I SAM-dependent methyltransferase [Acidimicrobiales bacterium]|nr:class I SAM-dependent methyltransferase [Acidimicrobiales bacterium]
MSGTPTRYDTIGRGYAQYRRPDPRIEEQIWRAVGDATTIVNVGAGTGSYERAGRSIVAVEPSDVMARQRPASAGPVLRAAAECLPFADRTFDVALALMTVHHWEDMVRGIAEMRRVAERLVIFTFEPALHDSLWVFTEYVPASLGFAHEAPLTAVSGAVGRCRVEVVPVPADCTDGFAIAYWRRPGMYLDRSARDCISAFARLGDDDVLPGMHRLERDLRSGAWAQRHADLLDLHEVDLGLRLVVSE